MRMFAVKIDNEMRLVSSMAKAYVEQIKSIDVEVYAVDVTDAGAIEIVDGPITILTRYRLYGDPNILLYSFGRLLAVANFVYFIPQIFLQRSILATMIVAIAAICYRICSRAENAALGQVISNGMAFIREVQELTGTARAHEAINRLAKGQQYVASDYQDVRESEGDRKSRAGYTHEVRDDDDSVR